MRDELLGTTHAGREWITLFEHVQTPLIAAFLGNRHLSSEAAALVERAGRLAEDPESALTDEDVDRGVTLIRALSEQAEAHARVDLEAVRGEVEQLRGVPMGQAIQTLMLRGPRTGGAEQDLVVYAGPGPRAMASDGGTGLQGRRSSSTVLLDCP